RRREPDARRRAGVAGDAARLEYLLHSGEVRRGEPRSALRLRRERDDEREAERRRDRCGRAEVAALVPQVEEIPDERAEPHEAEQHEPAVLAAVREREVLADHREEDRQRQVVVVDGPLLATDAGPGIGLTPRGGRGDEGPLAGDDGEEHV